MLNVLVAFETCMSDVCEGSHNDRISSAFRFGMSSGLHLHFARKWPFVASSCAEPNRLYSPRLDSSFKEVAQ